MDAPATRRLVYYVACTADGYIAREDGSFDFFPSTGAHLAHIAQEYPETIPTHLRDVLGVTGTNRHFDTVLMGRATYEVGSAIGVTSPYAHLRQYVVSTSIAEPPGAAVEVIRRDASALVRRLKGEPGLDIWLCGGAHLAGTLVDEIDELVLKVNPVVLGSGIPLLRGVRSPLSLELVGEEAFDGGVIITRYRVHR